MQKTLIFDSYFMIVAMQQVLDELRSKKKRQKFERMDNTDKSSLFTAFSILRLFLRSKLIKQ